MKVLMLGWEFPPLFSGGLGIATLGIVQALSSKASVKLIVPAYTGSFNMPGVSVIGLNAITASELNVERLSLLQEGLPAEVHSIPITISPYEHVNRDIAKSKLDRFDAELTEKSTVNTIHELFSDNEVYGWNVMLKMRLYTQLVEEIAKDADFDVVHAHDWITFSAGMRIKARTGKPLVLLCTRSKPTMPVTTPDEIYSSKAMTVADGIISVSHFTKISPAAMGYWEDHGLQRIWELLPKTISSVINWWSF
jgi:hypothetical protein